MAKNIRGKSRFSDPAQVVTRVDAATIPRPSAVHYERSTGTASFRVENVNGANSRTFALVARVELENEDGTWSHYAGVDGGSHDSSGELQVRRPVEAGLRVRLCLRDNELLCGPYAEALVVDVRPGARTQDGANGAALLAGLPGWLVLAAAVLSALLLVSAVGLVLRRHCGPKGKSNKSISRPSIIHGSIVPPPYNSSSSSSSPLKANGLENKGVDSSAKDVSDDHLKLYGSYPHTGVEPQSNSNSANGGSVNSQDSLWNVKNGGITTTDGGQTYHAYQNGYPMYDPASMQQQHQQPGMDDYTHYPYPDEYLDEATRRRYLGHHDATNLNGSHQSGCKLKIPIPNVNHHLLCIRIRI